MSRSDDGHHEDRLEIERHHRDFVRISDLCDRALERRDIDPVEALKQIRNIVG